MAKVAICSICSRAKKEDEGPLPAAQRYIGSHIAKVQKIAEEQRRPFFILSGVYGFVSAEEEIPYYDHLLVASEVGSLVTKIQAQLKQHGVEEVLFYTKNKPAWEPYLDALRQAANAIGVKLVVEEMGADD